MQLEQASLPGPVGRVTVEAQLTAPLENRQGELFAGGEHEASRQLALLIDRCSSHLGQEAVLRPKLTADPLPERAVKYVSGVRRQGSGVRNFLHSALERPLDASFPPARARSRFSRPGWSASQIQPPRASSPRRSLLGSRADRSRLVARQKRAPRLLAHRNSHRPALLALPPPDRRQMASARRVRLRIKISRRGAKTQRKGKEFGEFIPQGSFMTHNEISRIIIDTAIDIHRRLGPGLLESVYLVVLGTNLRSADCVSRRKCPFQ